MTVQQKPVSLTAEELAAETLPLFDHLEALLVRAHRGVLTTGGCGSMALRVAGLPDTEMLEYIREADEAIVRVSELAEKARAVLDDLGQADN